MSAGAPPPRGSSRSVNYRSPPLSCQLRSECISAFARINKTRAPIWLLAFFSSGLQVALAWSALPRPIAARCRFGRLGGLGCRRRRHQTALFLIAHAFLGQLHLLNEAG